MRTIVANLPKLRSLRRHMTPAIILIVEISLACAVLCNASLMALDKNAMVDVPNGIAENELAVITASGADPKLAPSDILRNIDAIRRVPGVESAAASNTVPFSGSTWQISMGSSPQSGTDLQLPVSSYFVSTGGDKTLGLDIVDGRNFLSDDYKGDVDSAYQPTTSVAIVSESVAQRLWPDVRAVGKVAYAHNRSYQVVGVAKDVLSPSPAGLDSPASRFTAFFPLGPSSVLTNYLIRCQEKVCSAALASSIDVIARLDRKLYLQPALFRDIRARFTAPLSNMARIFFAVCLLMIAVTSAGIVGLSNFWVRQRTRQIGIRRALGATKRDILLQFMFENLALATVGAVLGMVFAYGVNIYSSHHFEIHRLPLAYLPAFAALVIVLGQLSALGPALRAASVAPIAALRSR